jgi:hypothetical protein
LRSLFGGAASTWTPGDQVWYGTDAWTVRAVLRERGSGREWATLRIERGAETAWITPDGDTVVRYDPLPGVRPDAQDRVAWNGRTYACTERGDYAVVGVVGEVNAGVGDRARYMTLTSADDPERWLSVESWEGGAVEVSAARPWRIDRVARGPAARPPS